MTTAPLFDSAKPLVLCASEHSCRSGSLIYEYIGEVVAEKTFRRRIQQYADEGLKHFYFMMLQKEEVGHSPHSEVWISDP